MIKCIRGKCYSIWDAIWPTLIAVLVLVILAMVLGAQWPNDWSSPQRDFSDEQLQQMRDGRGPSIIGWQDFAIFFTAIVFLWIKSSILLRRMRRPVDWLTLSLVAANISFSILYLLIIAAAIFPLWFYEHPYEALQITRAWRIIFIASIGWGIIMFATLPDARPEEAPAHDDHDVVVSRKESSTV